MNISTSGNNGNTSCGLNVYDFNEEDEHPADKAMLKYKFLHCVAQGGNDHTEERGRASCVDVGVIDIDQCRDDDDDDLCGPSETVREDCEKENVGLQYDSTGNGHNLHFTRSDNEDGAVSSELETKSSHEESRIGKVRANDVVSKSLLDDARVDMNSDAHESMSESSPSTSASNFVINEYGRSLSFCLDGLEMEDENDVVNLSPDYIVFQDIYCTDAQVRFCSSSIQIHGSLTNGNQRSANSQWGIDDIVDLECHWYGRIDTAIVKLHVISEDATGGSDVLGPSGVQEWLFAVVDSDWHHEQDKIISLSVKYKAIWNVVLNNDTEMDEEASLEQKNILSEKHFFPNFRGAAAHPTQPKKNIQANVWPHPNIRRFGFSRMQPFEDVIYPHGDADAVSLSKRDADLLQPETFINDTIVDFYIKYLSNKIPAEERHRFHFFNSFFFPKLVKLDKDPFTASEGRTAFLRVRKWTRKVNLFEKDYIFIPVNFNLHWSLIVICHPGEVTNFKDEEVENTPRVPCILHMDSIKGMHAGLKNHIQSYLWEEWKEKENETSEEMYSKFCNMRFVQLELPQQENSFDCGLFLLHYVELFLEEVPDNFSPFKITKFSSFLNVDWFPPTEASLKRAPILKLIYDILQNLPGETSSNDYNEEHEHIDDRKNKNEADVKLYSDSFESSKHCHEDLVSCQTSQSIKMTRLEASSTQKCAHLNGKGLVENIYSEGFEPSKHYHEDLLSCQTSQSIKMTLLETSSTQSFEHLNENDLVARECFDPDVTAMVDAQFQVFNQAAHLHQYKNPLPPIEEDPETGEQFVYSPSGRTVSGGLGVSSQAEQQCDNSSSDPTTSASDNDDCEAGSRENNSYGEDEELILIDDADQQRSPSMENIDCSLTSPCSEIPEGTLSGTFDIFGGMDDDGDGDDDAGDGDDDHASDGDIAGDEDHHRDEHHNEDRAANDQAQDGSAIQSRVGGEDQAIAGDEDQVKDGNDDQAEDGHEDVAGNFLPVHPDTDIEEEEEDADIKCRDDLFLVKHGEQAAKRRRLTDYRSE